MIGSIRQFLESQAILDEEPMLCPEHRTCYNCFTIRMIARVSQNVLYACKVEESALLSTYRDLLAFECRRTPHRN